MKDYQFPISQPSIAWLFIPLRTKSNEKWVDGNAKREANEWGAISQADTAGVISRTRRVLILTRSHCVSWAVALPTRYLSWKYATGNTRVMNPVRNGLRFLS